MVLETTTTANYFFSEILCCKTQNIPELNVGKQDCLHPKTKMHQCGVGILLHCTPHTGMMQYSTLPVDVAAAHQIVDNCRWEFSTEKVFVAFQFFCALNCRALLLGCSFSVY